MLFKVHSLLRFVSYSSLTAFFAIYLAACGDDEPEPDAGPDAADIVPDICPDGPAEPLDFNPPEECSAPGEGELYFRLSRLDLPGSGPLVGFDLDDYHTDDREDPIGCGVPDDIVDCRYGIDNKLPAILKILRTASSSFGQLQGIIDEALEDGSIDLRAIVRGYDGKGDDEAHLTLYLNGELVEGVEDYCVGVNSDGAIAVRLDRLPIAIPPIPVSGEDVHMLLDLSQIKLLVDPPNEEGVSRALLGGAALWDDGEGGGLKQTAISLVERLLPSVLPTLDSLMSGMLDMGEPGACNSISVGIEAGFSTMDELGVQPGDD